MTQPLVTVTIPTYNSARTLQSCLQSVAAQDYPAIETTVVDSHSTDATPQIAEHEGATYIPIQGGLLAARVAGIRAARGEFVLLLDSDHVLNPTAIRRAVKMMQSHDVLYLEERSIETKTLIQRLFDADRQLIQSHVNLHTDALRGVLLGRFFRTDLLAHAVDNIPSSIVQEMVTFDHEIINYEALLLTDRVALLPEAVYHHEPRTLLDLWRKNLRYGRMARRMARFDHYVRLRRAKARPRLGAWKPQTIWWGLQSHFLLALKAPAILAGYLLG